jgi:hypothetical protein
LLLFKTPGLRDPITIFTIGLFIRMTPRNAKRKYVRNVAIDLRNHFGWRGRVCGAISDNARNYGVIPAYRRPSLFLQRPSFPDQSICNAPNKRDARDYPGANARVDRNGGRESGGA